ncbi:hypothetical protein [uncultured Marinobacter sp.]|uniref:hypothetical protein n=1 Tax=uncultured Marinobacter sp. TaxID=187379 RepID=UPI0030D74F7F|tara:strand:+ start:2117 stop:2920 length:804 start_codon:yes stop_codon:yes gene_type:complete
MKLLQHGVLVLGALMALPSSADQVKTDDLIVQGNLCVGQDCLNGEDFSLGALKLKENNTRIRWHDTSATSGALVRQVLENSYLENTVGQSWGMDANQSSNGGLNGFYIIQKSLVSSFVLSDGTAPDYDCVGTSGNPRPVVGTIQEGQPVESEFNCLGIEQFLQLDTLVLGGSAGSGAAVGIGAELADGEVSLGSASLRRRLVHVASALGDSDVLIKSQLDAGLFQDRQERLDGIESLMDMAEQEIATLEEAVKPTVKPKGGGSGATG